ncbi:hypothetical protein NR756_04830 [Alloalcanivorax xenomutans]|jgi:hypothetical protein|uniref:hypothetical protein n=1 Tax=Alloalcanivorax xenomutans TaxID=1094342 RepID=UPI000E229959
MKTTVLIPVIIIAWLFIFVFMRMSGQRTTKCIVYSFLFSFIPGAIALPYDINKQFRSFGSFFDVRLAGFNSEPSYLAYQTYVAEHHQAELKQQAEERKKLIEKSKTPHLVANTLICSDMKEAMKAAFARQNMGPAAIAYMKLRSCFYTGAAPIALSRRHPIGNWVSKVVTKNGYDGFVMDQDIQRRLSKQARKDLGFE